MQINITKMGDVYVITENNETQSVYTNKQEVEMKTHLANLMLSEFIWDDRTVQVNIELNTESFTMKDAKPVAPKPFDL